MPFIEAANPQIASWTGLHLFHAGLSSCSQRVRIVLAEKGLDWESHVVDLRANEHATAWYQSINPDGLVPALVVDGRVMIESIDIIDWLDATRPEPPLRPADPAAEAEMLDWMQKADAAQYSLKVLSHEFLFKPAKRLSPEALEDFLANHKNEKLRAFMRTYCSEEGFTKEQIDAQLTVQHDRFAELDATLADGRSWILGEDFTLADVAWAPNVHRMGLMDYPLDRHPHLSDWYARLKKRPSYRVGLEEAEGTAARSGFAAYSELRRTEGTDVTKYGPLAG